ncbi:MAG: hypothetical protein GY845_33985 [Planctomycetes bacterium]|nr:hypothetical protein [Planctomycetota bacterium]
MNLPPDSKALIVLALAHPKSNPELDWWDGNKGTSGNRELIRISNELSDWLKEQFDITAHDLPYHVENGGIFLKDAAVLAGLGCIGKNNLLITPDFGPRVRLRALAIDFLPEVTGPIKFDPCVECDSPCQQACPQNAFQSSSYNRPLCTEQMETDKANAETDSPTICIKYCRACELACPYGISV